MFNLSFKTDNDAFAENPQAEIARILRAVAERIEFRGDDNGKVADDNGNTVGSFTYA